MSRIKINKNDKNRVLLTELLPYEAPLLFSNEGFYEILKEGYFEPFRQRILELKQASGYTIPFDYRIKRANGGSRKLSIIHPLVQLEFLDFYEKYHSLILSLCSRSSFSLRYPARVAKYCYSSDFLMEEDEHKGKDVEVEPDILNRESKLLKSYFSYKKYDLVYKFFDSYEFFKLEQRFKFMMSFDISKCFYNIYTHSICWAIKNKEISKRNSSARSFENDFDKIMQKANYNETNGIIVGPEVARIFAEIILQQVDLDVLNQLDGQNQYYIGTDYEIRRYVDDYYVFTNKEGALKLIFDAFVEKLEDYKLYVNSSKTEKKNSPFVHNIAVCRYDVKLILDDFDEKFIKVVNNDEGTGSKELVKILKPYGVSRNLIKKIQYSTKKNQLTYDIVGTETIRHLKRILLKVLKEENIRKDDLVFVNFCLVILDVAFFAYSMDTRVNTTYKISQIIVLVCKVATNLKEELKHVIYSKIIQESDFIMTNHKRRADYENVNIEILNLLVALKKLEGDSYLLSENKIKSLLGLKKPEDARSLNYFEITSILYYIGNHVNYEKLKSEIESAIIYRFEMDEDCFSKAEHTCMFFDLISCPFIGYETKKDLMRKSKYIRKGTSFDKEIAEISKHVWFMNWGEEIDLERVLKKKEWGSSY